MYLYIIFDFSYTGIMVFTHQFYACIFSPLKMYFLLSSYSQKLLFLNSFGVNFLLPPSINLGWWGVGGGGGIENLLHPVDPANVKSTVAKTLVA